VLVVIPSPSYERRGTTILIGQDRPCDVFACDIRGAIDQQIAQDTDVDQVLFHPFLFSLSVV